MGSDFIRYLFEIYPQIKVLNFDKLTYAGNLNNLSSIKDKPGYSFVKGDITDRTALDPVVERFKPDVIVNFAAETHNDRAIIDPQAPVRTNVLGTQVLVEVARQAKLKRFHQVSTDEVYGSIRSGKFSETSPLLPNTPYSAPKAGGDLIVRAYHKTYGLAATVSRACNNFGPFQYPEKMIPLFLTNLLEGKKVPLYGQGTNVREWLFVTDHSRALDHILAHGRPGEIYNIGSGYELSNLELTRRLIKLTGQSEAMIELVKDRPGHDFRYALDSSKLGRLGWKPIYSFDQALAETVKWYQNNKDWW